MSSIIVESSASLSVRKLLLDQVGVAMCIRNFVYVSFGIGHACVQSYTINPRASCDTHGNDSNCVCGDLLSNVMNVLVS